MKAKLINIYIDYVLIAIICFCAYLIAYHPYYFGDELISFHQAEANKNLFFATFRTSNEYKPRLIFNGLWSILSTLAAPRWIFMVVVGFSAYYIATLLYSVSRLHFKSSRFTAWLIVATFLMSRFGVITYYDYVSGTIELISLAFFVSAVVLVLAPDFLKNISGAFRSIVIILLNTLAVFVHERYLAGSFALGVFIAGLSLRSIKPVAIDWPRFILGVTVAILPLSCFLIANKICGSLPLVTGTSGQKIAVSLETAKVFWDFFLNVFFGQNYGQPWLVGSLNNTTKHGEKILVALALMSIATYSLFLWFSRERLCKNWRSIVLIAGVIGGLILVASLPGPTRQEGRWMIPVAALIPLLALSAARGWIRGLLLSLYFVTSATYLVEGSQWKIVNVAGSNMSNALATSLNTIKPMGAIGIMVDSVEPDTSWVIANGASEETYSRINLHNNLLIYTSVPKSQSYDFGIVYISSDLKNKPRYAYLSKSAVKFLKNPDMDNSYQAETLGGQGVWSKWTLSSGIKIVSGSLLLTSTKNGFLPSTRSDLNNKIIIYRAKALAGQSPMRIQVNWQDKNGAFISAYIKVVEVNSTEKSYAALLEAPNGASEGMVYATLHDGAKASVELKSVKLIDPRQIPLR